MSSPGILVALASLECRRRTTLQVGPARDHPGRGAGLYVRDDAVNIDSLHVDQQMTGAVGRMGGHTYALIRNQFDNKTMTLQEWEQPKAAVE